MTEETKYYTPEIEELCVGLEFEYKYPFSAYADKEKIDFQPFAWDSPTQQVVFCKNGIMIGGYHISEFRVKYLDREDIESLGWEKKEKLYKKIGVFNGIGDFFTKKIYCKRDQTEKMVILFYNKRYNHILIYDEENKANRFVGTIKNKSELINQLKRCGI